MKENSELSKTLEEIKKELAQTKSDYEKAQHKLDGFQFAKFVLSKNDVDLKKQSRQKENQGFGYNKRSVNRRKEKLKPKALPEADLEVSNKESQETEKAQSGSHSSIKNHILCEPEPEKMHFQFAEGTEGLYMLVGSDKLFSDKEFPIKNVNQS